MHVRASRPRRARRRPDRRSTDGGRRTDRAGSPFSRVRRIRTSSPRPTMASADARRPTSPGHGSAPSPSLVVFGAQHATQLLTRLLVFFLLFLSTYLCYCYFHCFI